MIVENLKKLRSHAVLVIDMKSKIIKKFLNFVIIEGNIGENGYDYILRNDQTLDWCDGF